ncbi:MAG: glycosyltransferase family 4 protein [Tetrasphaera sp.]|nr:glycosyltransferase family 4 protein [Tetrasphaera sp.]
MAFSVLPSRARGGIASLDVPTVQPHAATAVETPLRPAPAAPTTAPAAAPATPVRTRRVLRRRRRTGPIKVAMIGQKGLPATFGGVEHHVEKLGAILAERGDVEVMAYCRKSYSEGAPIPASHQGIRLVTTPTINSKHLDAIVHSITSTIHAMATGADVIHYHAMGPGLAAPLPRFLGRQKVVLTVHGLDNERAKWGGLASKILGLAHWMSGHVPDQVVTVSKTLAEHYDTQFAADARYIPNGVAAPAPGELPQWLVDEFGLTPGGYVLFVGRVVPEKRPDLLVEAMKSVPQNLKVAIVGGSSFTDEYVATLRAAAAGDDRIVFPGYVHGADLQAVYSNAAVFVQPSDLEGLPLTLLEAISYGIPVVASDIPPHKEVLDECSCGGHQLFVHGDAQSLAHALRAVLQDTARAHSAARDEVEYLLKPYSWTVAAEELASVYGTVTGRR